MHVDTMRKIDHHVGIPLCFLLGLWFRLWRLLVPAKISRPQNLLLIELSEMGSAIIVDPAMRRISEFGGELHFVIFHNNVHSLRLLQTVPEENIFTLRDDGLIVLAIDTLRFLFWCRRKRIDTVIDLELFSRFTALLSRLSGADNLVGFDAFHNEGLYRGDFLTHRVGYNPHIHIAKNFMALIYAAFSDERQLPFTKQVIDDDQIVLAKAPPDESGQKRIRQVITELYPDFEQHQNRLVLINPNASDLLPQRRWMPENFVVVIKSLLERHSDLLVLITGAPSEIDQAARLVAQIDSPRCLNFAGKVKFAELIPLYQLAALLLTNDSGPGHFSAVTDIPSFVIFGPETPALYGSLGNSTPIYAGMACSPCVSAANHRKTPCKDNRCLKVITPEEVLDLLEPVLVQH